MASNAATIHASAVSDSPFNPRNDAAYQAWREQKLARLAGGVAEPVPIQNANRLTPAERGTLAARCAAANLVIYRCPQPVDKASLRKFGEQLGLTRLDANLCADEDAISSVRIHDDALRKRYIPYSNRALNWHTDGYYNPAGEPIRSFILHCVQDAAEGGENAFLDPEIVYLLLRDANPDHILALMQPEVMTIPPNTLGDGASRRAQTGPVFFIDPVDGTLRMRFTARSKSVEWKNDARVRHARAALDTVLRESPHVIRRRLIPGQGVVTNNVLHSRSAFRDDSARPRLLYRARYYNRVRVA